jgi:LacI family transcriptional regulator
VQFAPRRQLVRSGIDPSPCYRAGQPPARGGWGRWCSTERRRDWRLATQHLLQSGHKAVGFLAGPLASRSSRQRAKGYRAALTAAALPHNPDWTRHCSPVVQSGRETARHLLTAYPELTAFFCYNDLVAVGALQACADLGRRVPDDLAVVGFDDILLAALVMPPLTTCRVRRYEFAAQAMWLLLDQINGCHDECAEIVLQPELIVRASAP